MLQVLRNAVNGRCMYDVVIINKQKKTNTAYEDYIFTGTYCSCFFIFFWGGGYLKAQIFTHTLPDINSLKNAIRQEIANVKRRTLRRVMASVPGRWQQYLDCHGGHLQGVVLKTWGSLWIQDIDLLDHVQLYLLLCTVNVLSYFQNG